MGFLPAPNETVAVITGEIEAGDADKFIALIDGRPFSQLVLDSKGGDYFESLYIARHVYMRGVATIAPLRTGCQEGEDATCVCASACVFIWAAGRPRIGSRLVIHTPILVEGPAELVNNKARMADHVRHFLGKLEVPQILIDAVIATPFDSPRPLTEEELQVLQPFTYDVPDEEHSAAKAPD